MRRDTDAVIAHRDEGLALLLIHADADLDHSTAWTVFDGITQQIKEDLVNAQGIDGNEKGLRRRMQVQRMMLRGSLDALYDFLEKVNQVCDPHRKYETLGLNARDVQQGFSEFNQATGRYLYFCQGLVLPVCQGWAFAPPRLDDQHIDKPF